MLLATPACAEFGLKDQALSFTNKDGTAATQAGSHPFAMTTTLDFNTVVDPEQGVVPDGAIKDVVAELPPGFAVDPNATPLCSSADFRDVPTHPITGEPEPNCPLNTVVGYLEVRLDGVVSGGDRNPVYNLERAPGVASKLGFRLAGVSAVIEGGVRGEGKRNLFATVSSISQAAQVSGSQLVLWGKPADPAHDDDRGYCLKTTEKCSIDLAPEPFITLPRSCTGPLQTIFDIDSWQSPGTWVRGDAQSEGMTGCGKLGFGPSITAKPTTKAAQSATGLDFSLDVDNEGLTNPSYEATADSDIKRAVVTLPEGFTTNPSIAEGLNVCTEAELKRETAFSDPGAGCPNASKIGTVEVETPLLDENVDGALFIAKPYENEFNSLLALYIVIKNPNLGIVLKQALKVENDPVTGRITTVADDLPQLPFSHFRLHFREGTRSPLASPPGCGTYAAEALLTPWAGGPPVTSTSTFQIITGPNAGPCPSGGTPPFHPGLVAGTINNAAGTYSPFNLRLSRNDGEGEFTRFSIKLPPGIVGKLAGIPFCPDSAIAAAKARTGAHGGQEELDSPSCPAASQVGRSLAGAGVGPSLAYAPGKIYLAGPYHGSALSIAAITAAKVGPFDLGTVVIREALEVNPETAEVFIDATGSDPIPHIIKGIPVHARDIRAYVDRSQFVLNPTSCKKTSTASTVIGSGHDFGSASDDQPFTVTSPFQAADCASLGFGPKLALSLKGGTKRGQNPAFKAVLTARPGDANIGKAKVTLPHSAFLDQAHIKTICTRVQFKAGAGNGSQCPAGSIYGYAKAITPLLDEPIEGPVILRSSSNPLPDLVAALHSQKIDFNLVGRIDSVGEGQIRNTFELVPDAPVTKFTLTMQGGKKGLIVNSTNLCRSTNKAKADFTGQNGKKHVFKPVVKPRCPKAKSSKAKRRGAA
ncbi:MAG TPA: hypothetical protein VFR04_07460 [Solirubrobacterales bacterium]|nr:hypothetical protein [Solirubrobacterales bacterium]